MRNFLAYFIICASLVICSPLIANDILPKETNYFAEYDPVKTTRGGGILEKDVALDIAMKLGNKIKLMHPNIKVIYTRSDDTFIPLFERTGIANKHEADLFISIHCNASKNQSAKGTETFVMGLHTTKENLDIAKRENQSVLFEDNYQNTYGGYDPNSPEGHIILSAYQNQNLESSIALAQMMETEMSKGVIKVSRGVKQAGFVVLRTATMPSILIETGFLSNKSDRDFLSTFDGRLTIANSIFYGVDKFINDKRFDQQMIPNNYVPKKPELSGFIGEPTKPTTPAAVVNPMRYSVQIAAMSKLVNIAEVIGIEQLEYRVIKENEMYKYIVGEFESLPPAYELRNKLVEQGCKGAFLIKIEPSKKVFVDRA